MTRNPHALEELVEVHRSRTTPTLVIGDRVVRGFDRQELDELL